MDSILVLIDSENNEGWTLSTGDVLTQITDEDFPTDIVPGGAVLDGFLFIMTSKGVIHQSDLLDPTSWDPINVLTAEREPDKGVYLTKHLDHVVAFGSRTIEFFYNAANPVGNVLERRQDVSYRTGLTSATAIHNTGNKVYFIGSERVGSPGVYLLDNFQIRKISPASIDAFLHNSVIAEEMALVGSGFLMEGHEYFLITTATSTAASYSPVYTIVFDGLIGTWYTWDLALTGYSTFPLVFTTDRVSASIMPNFSILMNGDIIRMTATSTGDDTLTVGGDYMVDDYVDTDYVVDLGADTTTGMTVVITTTEFDGEVRNNKILHKLELVGEKIAGSTGTVDPTIRWSDDHYNTFSASRTIDISARTKLTRLGLFNRRAFELTYTGAERLRFEALELDWKGSNYA
jgi:hypothetical protein